MWWLTSVERVVGKDRGNVVNNDENRMISDVSVEEAIAEIEEKTGIPIPELKYQPQGMIFDSCDYSENPPRGHLQYEYNEYIVHINVFSTDVDSSYSWVYDGEVLSEEVVKTSYADVKIMEIKAENDEMSNAVAEWSYHNHQYQLFGKIKIEELKEIILNILY